MTRTDLTDAGVAATTRANAERTAIIRVAERLHNKRNFDVRTRELADGWAAQLWLECWCVDGTDCHASEIDALVSLRSMLASELHERVKSDRVALARYGGAAYAEAT